MSKEIPLIKNCNHDIDSYICSLCEIDICGYCDQSTYKDQCSLCTDCKKQKDNQNYQND